MGFFDLNDKEALHDEEDSEFCHFEVPFSHPKLPKFSGKQKEYFELISRDVINNFEDIAI